MPRVDSRFSPVAYACATYFLTLGCALAALSVRLEPIISKEYLHGAVFGFLLMFLASPLLFFARLPARLAMRVALLALVLWTIAFATVVVLFFPLQTVGIWLISVSESGRSLAIALVFVLVAIGIHVLTSGAIQAILDYAVATFFVLRAGPSRDVARAFAIGAVPAVGIAAVAALQGAVAWSSPPLTFDARLSGSIVIVGALVAAVAYASTAPPEARDDPFAARRQPPYAYIAAAGIAWLLIAPLLAPNGFAPPRLAIYAAPAYASLAHDGITEHALAETEARMGLSAASDRILVLYREPDGTRFTSHHAFLPDSNILVSSARSKERIGLIPRRPRREASSQRLVAVAVLDHDECRGDLDRDVRAPDRLWKARGDANEDRTRIRKLADGLAAVRQCWLISHDEGPPAAGHMCPRFQRRDDLRNTVIERERQRRRHDAEDGWRWIGVAGKENVACTGHPGGPFDDVERRGSE